MAKRRRLRLESLEDRCVPAIWGNPWPDSPHLTLSFAPDGTLVGNQQSQLFGLLANAGGNSSTAWQLEVLRAFQTWAVNADINVGLVVDGGQAFGTPGTLQGDARFGDVRIGGELLDPFQLAFTQPFDPTAGTWAGDVLFNTGYPFGINQPGTNDLFSVALHEAGHVFGLDDGSDVTSVMYDSYRGPRTGLSAGDVSMLQALYGARQPDTYEGASGNNSLATATPIGLFGSPRGLVYADITTLADVDYYKVQLTQGAATVQVQTSGISLLNAQLLVYDSSQQLVASVAASDPRSGDLAVHLPAGPSSATYYVRVQGASSDVFGIGSYQLRVVPDGMVPPSPPGNSPPAVVPDSNTNDTLASATVLTRKNAQTDPHFDYAYTASVSSAADVDFYMIRAPKTVPAGTQSVMTVMVWGTGVSALDGKVTVYDQNGNVVQGTVLVHEGGNYVLQLPQAQLNARYYVAVSAVTPGGATDVGNYFLGVDIGSVATPFDSLVSSSLSPTAAQATANGWTTQPNLSFTAYRDQIFHFVLNAGTRTTTTGAASVQMTISDAAGNVVATLVATAGDTRTLTLFLARGDYVIRFTGINPTGAATDPLDYELSGLSLSDPIEPYLIDPTLAPVSTTSNPTTSTSGSTGSGPPTSTSGSGTSSGTTTGGTSLEYHLLLGAYSTSIWF
jgi:hypothetical protein